MTLRNLLQASTGVEVNQVRGLNFYADQSRVREFFRMSIVHKPGTYYEYDQTAASVVIYVIQPIPESWVFAGFRSADRPADALGAALHPGFLEIR